MQVTLFSFSQAGWSSTDQPDILSAAKKVHDITAISKSLTSYGFSESTVLEHFHFTFLIKEPSIDFISTIKNMPVKYSLSNRNKILISGSVKNWYDTFTLVRVEFEDETIHMYNLIQLFFEHSNVRIPIKKFPIRDGLWITMKL